MLKRAVLFQKTARIFRNVPSPRHTKIPGIKGGMSGDLKFRTINSPRRVFGSAWRSISSHIPIFDGTAIGCPNIVLSLHQAHRRLGISVFFPNQPGIATGLVAPAGCRRSLRITSRFAGPTTANSGGCAPSPASGLPGSDRTSTYWTAPTSRLDCQVGSERQGASRR